MFHPVGRCGITFEKFQDIKEGDIIDKEAQVSGLRRITGAPMSPMIIRKGEVV